MPRWLLPYWRLAQCLRRRIRWPFSQRRFPARISPPCPRAACPECQASPEDLTDNCLTKPCNYGSSGCPLSHAVRGVPIVAMRLHRTGVARYRFVPQVVGVDQEPRNRPARCLRSRRCTGRLRAARRAHCSGPAAAPGKCWRGETSSCVRGYAFSHTEMWLLLSLVKGSRFQSLQRSRKVIPASRAIRSSSDGHT
jgi:hypothetical protein